MTDTQIEYELDTETWMGPWASAGATYEDVKKTAELFISSGLKAKPFEDLLPAQWSKLIFNSVISSISAVTELPHARDFVLQEQESDLGNLVFDMIEEGRKVASAKNVKFHEDPWDMNVNAIKRGQTLGEDYAHVASMLKDVWDQVPTEIDWITGAVVREAKSLGISVPLHQALYRLVKGKEASWRFSHLRQ